MAAKVGSVIVDVVAQTAEFEAGMRRAAASAKGLDAIVTEKAYQAAQAQAVAGKTAERYAQATQGLQTALGGATAAILAQTGLTTGLAGGLFRAGEMLAKLGGHAKKAAAAQLEANKAMAGGASVAKLMAGSLAMVAGKVALAAGATWGWSRAFREVAREWNTQQNKIEGSTVWMKNRADWLEAYSKWLKEEPDAVARTIEAFKAGRMSFEAAQAAIRELATGKADTLFATQAMLDARGLDDFGKKLAGINDDFAAIAEQAKDIQDTAARAETFERIGAMRAAEIAAAIKARNDEAAASAAKAHQERMGQIEAEAKAIASAMDRAAGLTLGVGSDAWKVVTEAQRAARSNQTEQSLLDRFGAGEARGERDSALLREMRDYLRTLANAETVPI